MPNLLSGLGASEARGRLRSERGLPLRIGPLDIAVGTPIAEVANAVLALYADYPVVDDDEFVDFEVRVDRPDNMRRWYKPQVVFRCDGAEPFNPLPGDQGFPLLEWGLNWCVYGSCHQHLNLHAAVLERGGRALILPAPSGSGKSTLCAALLFRGWRLLSDELTMICPRAGDVIPIPRPVSLKNRSIDVIRAFAPEVRFDSIVHETNKGVVGHFRAPAEAIRLGSRRASPAWVVVPKYIAEQPATFVPLARAQAFMHLIENAFNYDLFGSEGFELLASVIDRSECFTFEYGSVEEAATLFARLADGQAVAPN